jgi:DNA-binding NarL/FixJ family response regulator
MDRTRVVILSGRSLFVEGVASRLRQHIEHIDLFNVDSRRADALEQIVAVQPAAVILDATDPDVGEHCSLGRMLQAMPRLRVVRLDPQQQQVQLVTSEQRMAGDVSALIDFIEPSL